MVPGTRSRSHAPAIRALPDTLVRIEGVGGIESSLSFAVQGSKRNPVLTRASPVRPEKGMIVSTSPDVANPAQDPLAEAQVDVLIVGAGPIGLETAAELQRRGIRTLNLDRGPIGSQVVNFPPGVRWFSGSERIAIAGVPLETTTQEKATREDYLSYLRMVVGLFKLPVRTFESVESVEPARDGAGFMVRTRTRSGLQRRIQAGRIVLAIGGTARHRRLEIPGEDLPHVRREVGEPHWGHGRRVLVVGGRNSAADSAIRLWRAGARVTISYRGPEVHPRIKYWLRPELASCIRSGLIDARFGTVPVEITPNGAVLEHVERGDREDVLADDVLMQIGYEADGSLFEAIGCRLDGDEMAVVHDPETMETSVPGIHVAGTAVAGTQGRFQVYIENSHIHAVRIAAAMSGEAAPATPVLPELPES
ncbi:MAG: thioredoxin reductase [Planctomycetaceae bacterium]|nr:thioredoxin reductase [Planctomycetaceae bacterium]